MGPPGGNKPPADRLPPNVGYPNQTRTRASQEPSQQRQSSDLPYNIQPNTQIPPLETIPPNRNVPRDEQDSVDGFSHSRLNLNLSYQSSSHSPPYQTGARPPNYQAQSARSHMYPGAYRSTTPDEVADSTPNIFTSFIVNRMDYDGYEVPSDLRQRGNTEREVAQMLQRIGDDMSNNRQLNHLIGSMKVTPDTAYKTFFRVASQIFQDGTINWGRIVTLFYFAYKLAVQVLNQLPLIDTIIEWVAKFVAEKLARWIFERGGWAAAREYFGATSTQLFCVFCAGIALSSLFWLWKK